MTTNRMVQLVAVGITLICLLAVGLFAIPATQREREELQLGFARSADEVVRADIQFASSLLGPLKGFMVNALWYQVEQLKQQGKFAEINELSRTITMLQPRFPEVWRFHGWNLAYNVSVQTYTKEERWDWVNKGVRLLREEGIRYNPRAVRLYRELSWIFFHKIGQYSDDAHWYYKAELCREWQEILGIQGEGRDTEETKAEFKKIVDAPDTLDAVIAAHPVLREVIDQHIKPAGIELESGFNEARRKERERLLRSIGKVMMYNYVARIEELPFELRPLPYYDESLLPMLREPKYREAIAALLGYLRKSVLTENYRMNPAMMLAIMDRYGPVDYRAASSHSLYWAHVGIEMMVDRLNKDKVDRINTLRHRIHAIQDLTDSGKLMFVPESGALDVLPDIRFAEPYLRAVEDAEVELAAVEQGNDKPYEAGAENFMLKVFVLSYQEGNKEVAQKYRDKAAARFGKLEHNVRTKRYLLPMEDLFRIELASLIPNLESTRAFLLAMTQQALVALITNDKKAYTRAMKAADEAYVSYMKSTDATTLTEQDRMGLAPGAMVKNNFIAMMKQPSGLEFRGRMWRVAGVELRQAAWDVVGPRLKADAEAAKLDPAKVFPEPPGMAEYRIANPRPLPPLPNFQTTPAQPQPGPVGPVRPPANGKGPLKGS